MNSTIHNKAEHTIDKKVNTEIKSPQLGNTDNKENNKKKNKKTKKRKIKEPSRCQFDGCKKKLGLVKINCKCTLYFCPKHRTNHNCTYDYKNNNKKNQNLIEGNSNFKKIDKI